MVYQPFLQKRAFQSSPHVLAHRSHPVAAPSQDSGALDGPTRVASPTPSHEPAVREKNSDSPHPTKDPFLVEWDPDEEANPKNWSARSKWFVTLLVAMIGTLVGVAASIDSSGAQYAAAKFGVGQETVELQTAVFLIGFGVSAPIFGPLSELGGRVPVYIYTLVAFTFFQLGSGLAPNIQTRVILRFFAGFFGSSPLSNAGGSVADMVSPRERTYFFAVFACSGFLGPVLGPVMGGYISMSPRLGEQWCDYIVAIWSAALTLLLICFMRETYAPSLLAFKASAIRQATGDQRYKTALEKQRENISFSQHLRHALALPFLYLIYEPIVLLTTLYMSVIYIVLFGDFEAYPIIFSEGFGFNPGQTGLTFLAVVIGLILSLVPLPWIYRRWCRRARLASGADNSKQPTGQPPPEERLVHAIYGTWFMPLALFWQGWTSILAPDGSPWPAITAGVFFGIGILSCFISSYQYIIDVYETGSASALASLTFVRYIISGGAVMFTPPMYRNLGSQWALTLLACLSILVSFVPLLFYNYGAQIRARSRYATSAPK